MTAHVLTDAADTRGKGGRKPMLCSVDKPLIAKVYDYNMGTDNYTVGGNDLSSIWSDFSTVLFIGIEQQDTTTEADRRKFAIDYSAQKILVYTAVNTESGAANQGVVSLRLFAVGY